MLLILLAKPVTHIVIIAHCSTHCIQMLGYHFDWILQNDDFLRFSSVCLAKENRSFRVNFKISFRTIPKCEVHSLGIKMYVPSAHMNTQFITYMRHFLFFFFFIYFGSVVFLLSHSIFVFKTNGSVNNSLLFKFEKKKKSPLAWKCNAVFVSHWIDVAHGCIKQQPHTKQWNQRKCENF